MVKQLYFFTALAGLHVAAGSVSLSSTTSSLEERLSELERSVVELQGGHRRSPTSCTNEFPTLAKAITYSGCNRNMIRSHDAGWAGNQTVESCQSGVLTYYNTTSLSETGLFDAVRFEQSELTKRLSLHRERVLDLVTLFHA